MQSQNNLERRRHPYQQEQEQSQQQQMQQSSTQQSERQHLTDEIMTQLTEVDEGASTSYQHDSNQKNPDHATASTIHALNGHINNQPIQYQDLQQPQPQPQVNQTKQLSSDTNAAQFNGQSFGQQQPVYGGHQALQNLNQDNFRAYQQDHQTSLPELRFNASAIRGGRSQQLQPLHPNSIYNYQHHAAPYNHQIQTIDTLGYHSQRIPQHAVYSSHPQQSQFDDTLQSTYSSNPNLPSYPQHQNSMTARFPPSNSDSSLGQEYNRSQVRAAAEHANVLESINLLSKDESLRFTQTQINEPAKFIEKLERRVAVLETIGSNKKKHEQSKQSQSQKQKELQLRVRKQQLVHQRQLTQMRNQIERENRQRAQTLRHKTKESLEQSRQNHIKQQKLRVQKLNRQFFNPQAHLQFNTQQQANKVDLPKQMSLNASIDGSESGQYGNITLKSFFNNVGRPSKHSSSQGPRKHYFDTSVYANSRGTQRFDMNHIQNTQTIQAQSRRGEDISNFSQISINQKAPNMKHIPSKSVMQRPTASRQLRERKDKKSLMRIQDTLRQLDHIQTLKNLESQLLVQVYGEQADRHKYKSTHLDLQQNLRNRATSELDMYARTTAYQRFSPSNQHMLRQPSEDSTSVHLNNIQVPSSFHMKAAPPRENSFQQSLNSVNIARQTAQMVHNQQLENLKKTVEEASSSGQVRSRREELSDLTKKSGAEPQLITPAVSLFFDQQKSIKPSQIQQMSLPQKIPNVNSRQFQRPKRLPLSELNSARPSSQQNQSELSYNNKHLDARRLESRGTVDSGLSYNTALGTVNGHQQSAIAHRQMVNRANMSQEPDLYGSQILQEQTMFTSHQQQEQQQQLPRDINNQKQMIQQLQQQWQQDEQLPN